MLQIQSMMLRGDQAEVVSHYKYLGSVFTSDCTSDAETLHGVAAANSVFQRLRRANIWSARALTLHVKTQFLLMHCHVSSAILWRKWAVVSNTLGPLPVFQMKCLQHICGMSLRDHVPNTALLNTPTAPYLWSLSCKAKDSGGSGHVVWMPNDRLFKMLLFGEVTGLRPSGRARSTFNDAALRKCQKCQIGRPKPAYRDAQDKLLWREETCPART